MANIKSSKKRILQNEKRHQINLARKTSIKTAIKKVLAALDRGDDIEATKSLLRDAEAQLARGKSKGILHKNAAQRKIGALAKKVAVVQKSK